MAGNILGSTCFPQQLKLQFQKTACATPFSLSEKMFFNVMRNIFQWLEKYLFELLPVTKGNGKRKEKDQTSFRPRHTLTSPGKMNNHENNK